MKIKNINFFSNLILNKKPSAKASLAGGPLAPSITGEVSFYPAHNGSLVVAEVYNLPKTALPTNSTPPINPFGFHIHEGNTCEKGDPSDPFKAAMGHYNPRNMPHPAHAGDMPVLFGNEGYAFLAFFTDRFVPAQVIGRTVIIHQNPDDYRSQPAGDAGKRLACGIIRSV
ncbi:MAG: superoxide dismutase family protein [Acetivibrionales bacterium]|jgi:Cu-Zn family superoxide dismutase|nr:superoxide dismutase family protein [Clostridiaceae bacterium]